LNTISQDLHLSLSLNLNLSQNEIMVIPHSMITAVFLLMHVWRIKIPQDWLRFYESPLLEIHSPLQKNERSL
jgi:hypothetical protein